MIQLYNSRDGLHSARTADRSGAMRFSVTFENTQGTTSNNGPVTVGWFMSDKKGSIIYDTPERVRSVEMNREHAKSASRCPAVINMESHYFMVKCPFNIHIGFARDDKGKPVLSNLAGTQSGIRASKLGDKLHLTSEVEWRSHDPVVARPVTLLRVQI